MKKERDRSEYGQRVKKKGRKEVEKEGICERTGGIKRRKQDEKERFSRSQSMEGFLFGWKEEERDRERLGRER